METREEIAGQDLVFSDTILPSQYFGARKSDVLSPEKRLVLAVLIDAINVLQRWRSGTARTRRVFAEAGAWVNTQGTAHPFSFDRVCETLEIDPTILRLRLTPLILGHSTGTGFGMRRLRLKESSRSQHMSKNYSRRRRLRANSPYSSKA